MNLQTIADVFANSQAIVLLPHVNPDGDCLGSAYALKLVLKALGKQAQVKLEPSETSRVCHVLYGTEQEADFVPDCVVAVDCGDMGRLGTRSSLFEQCPVTVNIDHHPTNPGFAQHNLVQPNAAATGEIVFDLVQHMNVALSLPIATNLYVAICSDTGGFAYANTHPRTHEIAATLLRCGVEHAPLNAFLFEQNSYVRLQLMKLLLQTMETRADGRIVWISLTEQQRLSVGASPDDCSSLISLPRSLETAVMAFYFRETADGVKVSMRFGEQADAALFAQQYGGGGHARASGFTLHTSLEEAVERVIEKAEQWLEQCT